MKKMDIRLPSDYELLREADNFPVSVSEEDESIPEDILEKLKTEKVYIMYSHEEFVGEIWWDKDNLELKMDPWRYKVRGKTVHGKNLKELIDNYY